MTDQTGTMLILGLVCNWYQAPGGGGGGGGGEAAPVVLTRMCEYGVRKQTHFEGS